MNREQLIQFGEPILQTEKYGGLLRTRFLLVAFEGKPVGVGVFHNSNTFCSAAILNDLESSDSFISYIDEGHPVDAQDITYLAEIYNWAFK